MNLIQIARSYEKRVSFIYCDKSNVTLKWIAKYHFTCFHREHIFQIIKDIFRSKPCRVLDQGAAEGIALRLLSDRGFTTFAVDCEPKFQLCWDDLGIKGVIGDCGLLDWWDGNLYDKIIAGVWVACKGSEGKMTRKKKTWLAQVRDNWYSILASQGIVYFDVNNRKYPIQSTIKIISKKFHIKIFKEKPRLLLKCQKFS